MQSLLIFYLIWPAGAFVMSLKKLNQKGFALLFVLMALFMGLNAYTLPGSSWVGGDLVNYIDDVVGAQQLSWSEVFAQNDYYLWIMGKLLTPISTNRTFLATVLYIVYGGLFMLSFRIVIRHFAFQRNNYIQYFFLAALFLAYPYTYFNALRFGTAGLFFLWVLLEVTINKRKPYWLLFIVPPFIHYAFWIFIPVPFVWLLLRNRLFIVFVLFILSYSLTSVHTSYAIFNFAQTNFDDNITNTLSGYAAEDSRDLIDQRYEELKLVGNLNRMIFTNSLEVRNNVVMVLLGLITLLGYKRIKQNKELKQSITLLLVTASVANIAASISNGDRFYHITCLVAAFVLFHVAYSLAPRSEDIAKFIQKHKLWISLMLFVIVTYGLIHIYTMRNAYNLLNVFFGNVLVSFFV